MDSILLKADALVNGDRQADYADPRECHERAAHIATGMIGKDLTAIEVVRVLIAVKLARQAYRYKEDNLIDACGYLEIENRIVQSQAEDYRNKKVYGETSGSPGAI